jgi:hypothetical protein
MKSENQYLFKEKINEGKGEIQARKEIQELEYSQKSFKILYKENKTLKIMLKNKDIELAKLRKVSFKSLRESPLQKANKEVNNKKSYEGTLKHMGRLLNHMEIGKHYMKKELASDLCIDNLTMNSILYFLNDHHLVTFEFPVNGGVIRK